MSRRKQAKPRSIKREDIQAEVYEDDLTEDVSPFTDGGSYFQCSSPTEAAEVSSNVSDDRASLADGEVENEVHTCGNCGTPFDNATEFLDHLNQDCVTGGSNGGGGSSSLRSSDTPDDLSLSPGSCCPTPSSSGDPDSDLSYTVGVTENTPYGCQFCDKAFPRLSYLKRHEQVHSDQMPFRCDYCQRLFKHKRSRDRHVKLHTGDRKYRCTQCESAFSRSDHLKIHMKTHDNGKPYQCTVCNRGYNTAAALSSHMQNHKKTEPVISEHVTGNSFGQAQVQIESQEGQEEEDSPEPPKPLLCTYCPQVCTSPNALGDHVIQNHQSFSSPSPLSAESPRQGSNRCFKCLDELSSPNDACPHKKVDGETDKLTPSDGSTKIPDRFSPSLKLTCGFCSKSDFPTLESLQLHVQVLHVPTTSEASLTSSMRSLQSLMGLKRPPRQNSQLDNHLVYQNMDCDSSLSTLHMLQRHAALSEGLMLKHMPASDVYCSQCNIGFSTSAALLEHVQMVHENHVQRHASSPVGASNKRLLSGSRLKPNGTKHPKTSNMLAPHATVFNGNTSSHYRRQDPGGGSGNAIPSSASAPNATTLLCSQCNAGFPDFESFRTHLKSHLDAAAAASSTVGPGSTPAPLQRFSCPECNGEFASEALLDSHVATHFLSSTTEYGCQSCLKLFQKPDELQKHLMDVHAYHLYRCALCKQIFDSKVSIQVHFAVKHSNECRSLKCTSCSAYFRTEMEFQVHVKLTHLSGSSPKGFHAGTSFRCLLCDQLFPNEAQLRFHTSTHKKLFPCNLCGDAFHVEFLLDRHVQAVHQHHQGASPPPPLFLGPRQSSPGQQPQQQSEVAQNLSTKKAAGASQTRDQKLPSDTTLPPTTTAPTVSSPTTSATPTTATASTTREYRCDICDVSCSSEANLVAHRRQTHHVRTPHKSGSAPSANGPAVSLFCAYCNESCKSRAELENHIKAHTVTPSKHKCNICDEMCPSATTLAEHKLTHCKVVSGSTCIVCRVQLSNEEQFFNHIQQHNTGASNGNGSTNGLPVPCVVCRQTLVVDVEVRMHAKFHLKNASTLDPPAAAPCCVCSRMFDLSHLIIRGSGKHTDSALPTHVYMCKECFHSKGEDSAVLRCPECAVKFEAFADLEVHKRSAHGSRGDKKTYQCIKCQMSFESEAEIQAHVTCHLLHEGTNHECRLCHEVLDSPSKLQCHLIEHTFEGSSHYTCYLCSSVFTAAHLLQRHMLEHGLDTRPYDCSDCRQKFFFRAELENHSFVHMWENINRVQNVSNSLSKGSLVNDQMRVPFECHKCPCVFTNHSDLVRHQRTHHHHHQMDTTTPQDTNRTPQVVCSNCGMEFTCKEELRGHMILVHPSSKVLDIAFDKGNATSKDHYSFDEDRSNDLDSGVPVRSSLGPKNGIRDKKCFECPICKKRFTRKDNRKLHMKTHHQSSARQFQCSECGQNFDKRSHYKEHLKTHINTESHTCDTCDETFPSTSSLRSHQKDQHGRTFDHACVVCDQIFDDDDQLNDHQVRTHVPITSQSTDSTRTVDERPEDVPVHVDKEESNSEQTNDVDTVDASAKVTDLDMQVTVPEEVTVT